MRNFGDFNSDYRLIFKIVLLNSLSLKDQFFFVKVSNSYWTAVYISRGRVKRNKVPIQIIPIYIDSIIGEHQKYSPPMYDFIPLRPSACSAYSDLVHAQNTDLLLLVVGTIWRCRRALQSDPVGVKPVEIRVIEGCFENCLVSVNVASSPFADGVSLLDLFDFTVCLRKLQLHCLLKTNICFLLCVFTKFRLYHEYLKKKKKTNK